MLRQLLAMVAASLNLYLLLVKYCSQPKLTAAFEYTTHHLF